MQSRTAIVTGGAGGLGAAVVRRLADDGVAVVVADLEEARAAAGAAEHGGVLGVAVDVSRHDSAERMSATVLERLGRIDVLVNAAGVPGPTAATADYPVAEWHRVIDVNLSGVFHCTRACLGPMIEAGEGRIVNIASIAGKDGNANMPAYSASKAGVIALTKSAGKELATSGVLVNCVVPGVIDAGFTKTISEEERAPVSYTHLTLPTTPYV